MGGWWCRCFNPWPVAAGIFFVVSVLFLSLAPLPQALVFVGVLFLTPCPLAAGPFFCWFFTEPNQKQCACRMHIVFVSVQFFNHTPLSQELCLFVLLVNTCPAAAGASVSAGDLFVGARGRGNFSQDKPVAAGVFCCLGTWFQTFPPLQNLGKRVGI